MPDSGSVVVQLAVSWLADDEYAPPSTTTGVAGGVVSTVIPSDEPAAPSLPTPLIARTLMKYVAPLESERPVAVISLTIPASVQPTTSVDPAAVPIEYS